MVCDCPLKRDLLSDSTFPPASSSFMSDEEKRTRKMPLVPKPQWDTNRPSAGQTISMIVCMAENRVIGVDGDLPWHLPKDMKRFRKLTMGKPIVMGRKTYESIGRPLPGRKNLILTRRDDYIAPGCVVVNKLHDVLTHVQKESEIFVIGGESIYTLLLPAAHRIYLTTVHAEIEGDTFFPKLNTTEWVEESREEHTKDAHHLWNFTFTTLVRK